MVIVHVTGYFIETMAYQENLLPVGQLKLGHRVYVLTGVDEPDFGFNSKNRRKMLGSFDYLGVTVTRLSAYFEIKNKGPVLRGLFRRISEIKPDLIFIHDVGPSIFPCILYKLLHDSVLLQFDCHSTFSNARNSLFGPLYHYFFRVFFKLFGSRFDRLFAIAPETILFMEQVYGIKAERITLLPLPGDSSVLATAANSRKQVRERIGLDSEHVLLVHSGKLPGDKLTLEVLRAFRKIEGEQYRLIIAGAVDENFIPVLNHAISADRRIVNLGWLHSAELRELYCACDLLVQPGSLSNSFIDAICCGLPLLLDDTPQGRYLTQWGNGVVVKRGNLDALVDAMRSSLLICNIERSRAASLVASEYFDYVTNAKMTLSHLE